MNLFTKFTTHLKKISVRHRQLAAIVSSSLVPTSSGTCVSVCVCATFEFEVAHHTNLGLQINFVCPFLVLTYNIIYTSFVLLKQVEASRKERGLRDKKYLPRERVDLLGLWSKAAHTSSVL